MSKVKREYYLPGARYSQNKNDIKAIFKKHGLVWRGTFEFPQWMSGVDKIKAEFIRENDVTVGAKLLFEGDPLGAFCLEFTKFMDFLGAEYDDAEVVTQAELDSEKEKQIEEEIKHWERVHRPNIEVMRKGTIHNGWKPVPEAFINAALKDFKEKREIALQEIRAKIMGDETMKQNEQPEKREKKSKKKKDEDDDIMTDDQPYIMSDEDPLMEIANS